MRRLRAASPAAAIVIALFSACSAAASPELADIPPNLDAIRAAANAAAATGCASPGCQAVADIARSMDIMLDAQVTEMGLTRPSPADRDRSARRRFAAAILNHPERFAADCGMASRIASRYPGEGGDKFVAVGLIEFAARIEAAGGRCLSQVLAAFPASPSAAKVYADARVACVNAWGLKSECDRVEEPPSESAARMPFPR